MGKKSACSGVVALAMLIVGEPVHAGDRKSAAASSDSGLFGEHFVAPHVASLPTHSAGGAFTPVGSFEARAEHAFEAHPSTTAEPRERANGPIDRKITLFHFNTTRFGEVGVHPLLGGVKGLQVSVGF